MFAISGFHIGLVSLAVAWLARRTLRHVRQPLLWAALLGAAAAFGYGLLAGWSVPTQRTVLMISLFAVALAQRRVLSPSALLALALLLVFLLDPLCTLDPGFWLSFGAVAILLWSFLARWPRLSAVSALWWTQAVCLLALTPISLLLFDRGAGLASTANLLAVPVISLGIVPCLLLASALALLHPALAMPLIHIADWQMEALWWVLGWIQAHSSGAMAMSQGSRVLLVIAVLGAAVLVHPWPLRWRIPGLICCLCCWLPSAATRPDGVLELRSLDIGQGLAVLVRTAHHDLLIDAGPGGLADAGQRTVLPVLRRLGVRRLDAVVLTHGDDDHAGGLAAVMQQLPVETFWSSVAHPSAAHQRCDAGLGWHWDGWHFEFLYPPPGLPYRGNQSSCVLRISGYGRTILSPGDLEQVGEWVLTRRVPEQLAADVLLAPHHGSALSSTPAFMDLVRPQWVLVSSGYGNRFGFPRASAVRRWREVGADYLDTGRDGQLRLRIDAQGGLLIDALREQSPQIWREPSRRWPVSVR